MLIDLCEAVVLSYYPAAPLFEKSSSMIPSIEHTDITFLFLYKAKVQFLSLYDITVTLVLDEIHLKRECPSRVPRNLFMWPAKEFLIR